MQSCRQLYMIWIVSIQIGSVVNRGEYPASLATRSKVPDCPRNANDWQKAADRKNCDSVQPHSSKSFVYHCLIDTLVNVTVEVCVPPMLILGYCAVYSAVDAKIINSFRYECSQYTPPCPSRYNSTDAYKYGACYDKVLSKTDTLGSLANSTQKKSDEIVNSTSVIIAIVIPVIIIFILVTVIIVWQRWRVLRHNRDRGSTKDEEHPMNPIDNVFRNDVHEHKKKIAEDMERLQKEGKVRKGKEIHEEKLKEK